MSHQVRKLLLCQKLPGARGWVLMIEISGRTMTRMLSDTEGERVADAIQDAIADTLINRHVRS